LGLAFYLLQPSSGALRHGELASAPGGDPGVLLAADSLDAWAAAQDAPRDTTPRGRGLAALDSAAARAAGGRYESALAAYDSAAALLPTIAGWINLHAARAAAAQGDTLEVARRLDAAGTTIAREHGWDLRLRALEEAGA